MLFVPILTSPITVCLQETTVFHSLTYVSISQPIEMSFFIVSSDIENWNYLKESFQNFRQGEKASLITRNLKVTHSFEVSIWHFKIERRQNIWRLLLRWEEILKDTEKNTQLALKVRGETYPVRDCAIKTILDRAGSSGAGLRKLEKSNYARVVNYCLKVQREMRWSRLRMESICRTRRRQPWLQHPWYARSLWDDRALSWQELQWKQLYGRLRSIWPFYWIGYVEA